MCRMKADVLPTWSVKLVLELRPEEWECLPKGNGSRAGGFRGMHQSQLCQKMSPLWTGLITIVTALAHAERSWSHRRPFAFASRGNGISNARLRESCVWVGQLCSRDSGTEGLYAGIWEKDKTPAETKASFSAWWWEGLPKMTSSLPA